MLSQFGFEHLPQMFGVNKKKMLEVSPPSNSWTPRREVRNKKQKKTHGLHVRHRICVWYIFIPARFTKKTINYQVDKESPGLVSFLKTNRGLCYSYIFWVYRSLNSKPLTR